MPDTTTPKLLSTSLNGGTVAADGSVVFTFDEAVKAGIGNQFVFFNTLSVPATGLSELRYFDVTDSSTVIFSGNTVTIHPSTPFADGAEYGIVIGPNSIIDLAGNHFSGIPVAAPIYFHVTDTIAPVLFGVSPADDAANVLVGANIALHFNETVKAGAGNFEIRKASDGSLVEAIAIADISRVIFAGDNVSIDPSADLAPATDYYVVIPAGAVTDAAGNSYDGLTSSSALNFTTAAAPAPSSTNLTQPVAVNSAVTVDPGQTVNITYAPGTTVPIYIGFSLLDRFGVPRPDNTPPVLFNFGTIDVTADVGGPAYGVGSAFQNNGSLINSIFWNAKGGVLTVSNTENAHGYAGSGISSEVRNDGVISVTSTANIAYGASQLVQKFVNTGKISVSGAQGAVGAYPGPLFDNSGEMNIVTEAGLGYGVVIQDFSCPMAGLGTVDLAHLRNSGTITVVNHGNVPSVGVLFATSESIVPLFVNSGTITADFAFADLQGNSASAAQTVENSNILNGSIDLAGGDDLLRNSGIVNGAIYMGTGNDTVENTGVSGGDIFLGEGNDTYDGTAGLVNGRIDAGAGDDAIRIDAGDIFIEGGEGADTVYFAGSSSAYVITTAGTRTTVADSGGTRTVVHVENLVFGNTVLHPARSTGLVVNLTYDASVDAAPAGFKPAVEAAARFLESQFSDSITIDLAIGYGEAQDEPLASGLLGLTRFGLVSYAYQDLRAVFGADATSDADSTALASLPGSNPGDSPYIALSQAQADALGLPSRGFGLGTQAVDGFIGFSAIAPFDYDNSDGVAAGQFDFFHIAVHEMTHAMGRGLGLGEGTYPHRTYLLLDLFHYSAPGARDFSGTTAGYFSFDGGATNRNDFNIDPNGDPGDWANSVTGDAFRAFGEPGVAESVSANDLLELDVIGWDLAANRVAAHPARGDFDATGSSDILWWNDNGQAAIWTMDGFAQTSGSEVGGNPGSSWHVVGSGDFDGDGHADILWQNDNGQAAIWTFDGLAQTGGSLVGGNAGTAWHVKGAGDFDGDGKSDILWQNDNGQAAIWTMDGFTQTAGSEVGGNPGASWHVIGAGDFDGDGKADILWQNDNGQPAIWTMDGLTQTGGSEVGGNPGPSWHAIAAGDFNGDYKADILWQNDNGQAAIWTMDGFNQLAGSEVGGNPGSDWRVKGAGDFNGDGNADILWRNDNGQAAIWTFNGFVQTGGSLVGGDPGPSWHAIAIGR